MDRPQRFNDNSPWYSRVRGTLRQHYRYARAAGRRHWQAAAHKRYISAARARHYRRESTVADHRARRAEKPQ